MYVSAHFKYLAILFVKYTSKKLGKEVQKRRVTKDQINENVERRCSKINNRKEKIEEQKHKKILESYFILKKIHKEDIPFMK